MSGFSLVLSAEVEFELPVDSFVFSGIVRVDVRLILVGPVIGSAKTFIPSSESESLSDDDVTSFLSSTLCPVIPFIVIESVKTSI